MKRVAELNCDLVKNMIISKRPQASIFLCHKKLEAARDDYKLCPHTPSMSSVLGETKDKHILCTLRVSRRSIAQSCGP